MADKILTEAFDKLKAIEESEDPFCIGAKDEDIVEAYTEVDEADFPSDDEEKDVYNSMHTTGDDDRGPQHSDGTYGLKHDEAPDARTEPKVYQIDTNHGDNYAIHFQDEAGTERAYIEVNGITVATYTVGGAGAMQPVIKDDGAVLDALTHALHAANGSEGT